MDSEAYAEMIVLQEKHWWFVARREIIQSFINLEMSHNAATKVLEIGCGVGGNVELLPEDFQRFGIYGFTSNS